MSAELPSRARVEKFLASCQNITPDCPEKVLRDFIEEAGNIGYALMGVIAEEEEAHAALAQHLDEEEKRWREAGGGVA